MIRYWVEADIKGSRRPILSGSPCPVCRFGPFVDSMTAVAMVGDLGRSGRVLSAVIVKEESDSLYDSVSQVDTNPVVAPKCCSAQSVPESRPDTPDCLLLELVGACRAWDREGYYDIRLWLGLNGYSIQHDNCTLWSITKAILRPLSKDCSERRSSH